MKRPYRTWLFDMYLNTQTHALRSLMNTWCGDQDKHTKVDILVSYEIKLHAEQRM